MTSRADNPTPRRSRGDDGAALVEFTLIAVLLLTLVFAIINLGLLLSFKQDMTRAAAEGARSGAVAFPASDAATKATTGTQQAVASFDKTCGTGGMSCTIVIHDCDDPVPDTNGYLNNSQADCVNVELVYDYQGNPLITPIPMISGLLPDEVRAESDARLNP